MYHPGRRTSLVLLLILTMPYLAQSASELHSSRETYDGSDIAHKTPAQILTLRGFGHETHTVRTWDGYHINVIRVINPKLDKTRPKKRPVVFNHGLIESATIWLINSRGVKPEDYSHISGPGQVDPLAVNGTLYLNGPMMLANFAYDVFLMSMRGTDFSLGHDTLNSTQPEFWDYCLDDFALTDVPAVINYVAGLTGSPKVGYVGHSQATFSIFGLLATVPEYANLIEPVIAVAPVSYFYHITSLARPLFVTETMDLAMNGPFPPKARIFRRALGRMCSTESIGTILCSLMDMLIGGSGKRWPPGFHTHLPFYSSYKVLRHFGQLITTKRFAMYSYGEHTNKLVYKTSRSPVYRIDHIKSKSISLFWTKTDSLSSPKDVRRLKRRLRVPLYHDQYIDKDFNHFDMITDPESRKLVFLPILKIFEAFEQASYLGMQHQLGDQKGEPLTIEIPEITQMLQTINQRRLKRKPPLVQTDEEE